MREKVAFLFPGQGSQYIGMGRDILNAFPAANEIFEQVDEICQRPISSLCFDGPQEELTLTVNLQPAITAVNLSCLAALNAAGIRPDVSAGHSLGEYSALASAGVISINDTLQAVTKRGELMHREAVAHPGAMAAVLGLEIDKVEEILTQVADRGVVAIANHNTADQIVITGEREPLSYAVKLLAEAGGKAIPLRVSGAWHCSLMNNAVDEFRRFMAGVPFSRPEKDILFNATAATEEEPEKIKDIMAEQLTSPVKWYEIMLGMLENGVDIFVEVGPKKVLTGLLKKIIGRESGAKLYNVEDAESLERFLKSVK